MREIIANMIRTPDGTILRSYHRHDYKEHLDKNGKVYMVDGGTSYLRRNVHEDFPYEELSVYDDEPYTTLREYICRGSRGKDGKQPLSWIPLSKMSNDHLNNTVKYVQKKTGDYSDDYVKWYVKELEYRQNNNIFIPDLDQ